MRLLAKAHPSKQYRWYSNFANTILEARLADGKVYYYEMHVNDLTQHKLPEETVKLLFPRGVAIKEQPFTPKGNEDFYAVLYRHRKRFASQYEKLKGVKELKLVRTKWNKKQ